MRRINHKAGKLLALYTLLFAVSFIAAFWAFFAYNKTFIWNSDGLRQHFPVLVYLGQYFRDIIRNFLSGNFTVPMFDFSIGQGNDIVSTFSNYGLGDPLMFLAALCPTKYMEFMYDFLIVLRMYLAGASFLYFCCCRKKEAADGLIGALLYVFCGFVFWAVRHTFFITPMIYLPLLLAGVEHVMKKQGNKLFILAVCVSLCSGFYYFYMMSIFMLVYALIRFWEKEHKNTGREFLDIFFRCLGNYLIGILMACVSLLPAIMGFLDSTRTVIDKVNPGNLLHYSLDYYKNFLVHFIEMPGSMDYTGFGVLCLAAVVTCFWGKDRKKIGLKLGMILGFAVMCIPFGGYLFNAFGYVTNRWALHFSFLIAFVTVCMLPRIRNIKKAEFACLVLVGGGYGLALLFWGKANAVWYHAVLLILYMLTLSAVKIWGVAKRTYCMAAVSVFLVVVNIGINGTYLFSPNMANGIREYADRGSTLAAYETNAICAVPAEEGFFRVEADSTQGIPNVPCLTGKNSFSLYYSVINHRLLQMELEQENAPGVFQGHRIFGNDSRTFLNELASVKYGVYSSAQSAPYGYEPTDISGIYENQYALGAVYFYDSYIPRADYEQMNGMRKQEALMQGCVLEDAPEKFPKTQLKSNLQKIDYEIAEADGITLDLKNGVISSDKAKASLTLRFNGISNAETYLRIGGMEVAECPVVNFWGIAGSGNTKKHFHVSTDKYELYFGRKDYSINFGYHREPLTTLTLEFESDFTASIEDLAVYCQPMDDYSDQVERLKDGGYDNIVWKDNKMSGSFEVKKDKIVCFSVPYSSGWHAYVDGKPVEISEANTLYTAFLLSAGRHEVELRYTTPGIRVGAVFSLLGWILFVGWEVRKRENK